MQTLTLQATTHTQTYRGLACYTFKIDGALHFFMGTFATATRLAHELAQELGAQQVEVLT